MPNVKKKMSALDSQTSETVSSFDSEPDEEDDDMDYYDNEDIELMEDAKAMSEKDPEWYSFKCLDQKEVWSVLSEQVSTLSSQTALDIPSVRKILQHCNWKSNVVLERLHEDRIKLLKDSRVLPSKDTRASEITRNECLVCLDHVSSDLVGGCGHRFCADCWQEYLTVQVKQGKSFGIECMTCDAIVSMETVKIILKPLVNLHSRYLNLALTEIVSSHHLMRWCPGVDCKIIFLVEECQPKRIRCSSCQTSSCFNCGEEYHSPTECEPFKNWLVKCQDDSETFNYISANTKDCPKCHTSIEKNGGCNHLNCSICNHDFCWMCLEEWSKHCGEYYECSRYKADPEKYKDKASCARFALQKYLFYYQRWKNHHQSLLLEEQTRMTIQTHIEKKVEEGEGTWIDWQYLLDAAALLKKCRYTLKYTYPRAYWMEGDVKHLFEYQQAQLELEIENLSWKVERATITDRADLEQQMSITEVRRTTLLRDFTAA